MDGVCDSMLASMLELPVSEAHVGATGRGWRQEPPLIRPRRVLGPDFQNFLRFS